MSGQRFHARRLPNSLSPTSHRRRHRYITPPALHRVRWKLNGADIFSCTVLTPSQAFTRSVAAAVTSDGRVSCFAVVIRSQSSTTRVCIGSHGFSSRTDSHGLNLGVRTSTKSSGEAFFIENRPSHPAHRATTHDVLVKNSQPDREDV